ncbi:TniQ family protein [Arthrobacter castelli]|uniref:TniQ family protein n=1 Tax=Arthrobacter castelli TaxID=271431 RepID=UPI000424C26B|nr:TniQ family protein [Arthrobacter castelli]
MLRPAPPPEPAEPGAGPGAADGVVPSADTGPWPLRIEPVGGETFGSWLQAMAGIYQSDPKTIAKAMGLPIRKQNLDTFHRAAARDGWQAASATGHPTSTIRAMGEAWFRPTLTSYILRTHGTVLGPAMPGSSFCPACLQANHGRWLADWLHPMAVICPAHHVRLETVCPACGQRPWRGTAWLWTRAPGCECAGTIITHRDGRRRTRRCGHDLRQTDPIAVDDPQAAAGQQTLLELSRNADRWPNAISEWFGTDVINREAFNHYLGILDFLDGFTLKPTPNPAGSAARIRAANLLSKLAAGHRKLIETITTIDATTALPAAATTSVQPPAARTAAAAACSVHLADRVPAGYFPDILDTLNIGISTLNRIGMAVLTVRLGTGESWSRTGNRLGLQYKDHLRIPSWWHKIQEQHDTTEITTTLQRLAARLRDAEDPIDYGQLRREAAHPSFFDTAADTGDGSHGGQGNELLRQWADHTGGDPSFPPANYQHLC